MTNQKNKKKHPQKKKFSKSLFFLKKSSIYILLILLVILSIITSLRIYMRNIIYPQITIAKIPVSNLTPQNAKQKLTTILTQRLSSSKIILSNNTTSQQFEITLPQETDLQIENAISEAMIYGHQKPYFKPINIAIKPKFDKQLDLQIDAIAQSIDQPSIDSQLKIIDDEINVTPSQNGIILDKELLKSKLTEYINDPKKESHIPLPLKSSSPKLSYESALEIKKRLDQIKLSPLKLVFKDQEFILDLKTILDLIDLQNTDSTILSLSIKGQNLPSFTIKSAQIGTNEQLFDTKLTLNQKKIEDYLNKYIAPRINQPVEEPLFTFDGNKVTEFKPPTEGQTLQINQASQKISQALITQNQSVVDLPVLITKPKNKLANDLGIKELVGTGVSHFNHSIENRIYNVSHGASKINGILVAPGEEFSFNKTVGDITAATGFKQAYVIKSGRTVLDDGGGICQVSTTLFRAVLNAGLPITARTAHAYRVSYYEQGFPPGIDATIFYPSVDFKFKNDLPSHILIQTSVVGTTLYINLYSTSDGRISTLSKPVITSQTPAPPDLRQDDPTLPKGTIKQVDFAAAGANVIFNRTVKRGTEILIQESFKSNYRPWQAIYLIGTKEG